VIRVGEEAPVILTDAVLPAPGHIGLGGTVQLEM
jgi:hypothetical protein